MRGGAASAGGARGVAAVAGGQESGRGRKKTLSSREAQVSRKARESANAIAQLLGISRATVERVEELMAKAPELIEQVAAKARKTIKRLAARRVLGREYYRPVDASLIPEAQRVAAEHMRRYVRRDLHLRTLKVAWFSASDRPLSAEEWGDPITGLVLNMAVDPWVQQHGRVHGLLPSFVWCRSDLTPYMTARVVAHEAHHARQVLLAHKRRYQSTPGPSGPAARASRVAFQRRQREWERDAEAYSRKLAPVAREISQKVRRATRP